jgi:membrane protease YdiL (CAAX protease family)
MKQKLVPLFRSYIAAVLAIVAIAVQQIIALVLSLGDLYTSGEAKNSVGLKHGKVIIDNEREISLFDLPIGGNGLLWGSIAGIVMILLFAITTKESWFSTLALRRFRIKAIAPWIFAYLAYGVLSTWLGQRFEILQSEDMDRLIRSSLNSPTVAILSLGVFVPVFEELLFRGWLFGKIEQAHGGWAAIVVTTGLFLVAHQQYNWAILAGLSIITFIFGMMRWRTGSVLAPMLLHVVNNVIIVLMAIQEQVADA